MPTKRNRYSAVFNAKVAVEAIRGPKTTAELASEHQVHPTLINQWKHQALEKLVNLFEGGGTRAEFDVEAITAPLYEQIGRLKVVFVVISRGDYHRDATVDYEAMSVERSAPRWIRMRKKYGYLRCRLWRRTDKRRTAYRALTPRDRAASDASASETTKIFSGRPTAMEKCPLNCRIFHPRRSCQPPAASLKPCLDNAFRHLIPHPTVSR